MQHEKKHDQWTGLQTATLIRAGGQRAWHILTASLNQHSQRLRKCRALTLGLGRAADKLDATEASYAAHAQRSRAVERQAPVEAGLGCRVLPHAHLLALLLVQLVLKLTVLGHEQRLALELAN